MIGFDLARSDLPLKLEFPILLANAVSWLSDRDSIEGERAIRTGQPYSINASASVTVRGPDGEERIVEPRDGIVLFSDTHRAGIYEVEGSPEQSFAASLLDRTESENAPHDSIGTNGGVMNEQAEGRVSKREIWKFIALFALAILSFEWWAYHRRIA
jgi:hypothetical protein